MQLSPGSPDSQTTGGADQKCHFIPNAPQHWCLTARLPNPLLLALNHTDKHKSNTLIKFTDDIIFKVLHDRVPPWSRDNNRTKWGIVWGTTSGDSAWLWVSLLRTFQQVAVQPGSCIGPELGARKGTIGSTNCISWTKLAAVLDLQRRRCRQRSALPLRKQGRHIRQNIDLQIQEQVLSSVYQSYMLKMATKNWFL